MVLCIDFKYVAFHMLLFHLYFSQYTDVAQMFSQVKSKHISGCVQSREN